MDALHRIFSRRVKQLMAAKRLSVNHLADFAGIGRGRLSEILAGNFSPTLKTVAKLADALEVPASLLLTKPADS